MNPYLAPALGAVPRVLRRLLDQIDRSDLDRPLEADRFTAREVMAHMADWEPIMRARVEQACTRPGTTLEVFDEGQMALDNRYSASDPDEQLALFERERRTTVEYLRTLSSADLAHSVSHPERGRMTGDDLANLLLGHDMYHIEQLSAYLPPRAGD